MENKRLYINCLIYACGGCNWPQPTFHVENTEYGREHYANESHEFKCRRCDWQGSLRGSQAEEFLSVAWKPEIRSLRRS